MNKLEAFLSLYKSQDTVRAYKWALLEFFKSVYANYEPPKERVHAHEYRANYLNQSVERYFNETRNHEEDIQNFFVAIKNKPPVSIRAMLNAVKTFLVENNVELKGKFWRRLINKIQGNQALTLDKVPSNVELRRIISHMSIQGKALYLVLSSSGMRIGEALQLKLEDLELDSNPVKVNIQGNHTKTGNSRIAFISCEAKEAVEEWLKVRTSYILSAVGKSHLYEKTVDDSRLFPFENNTAYAVWTNAVGKAGLLKKDASTNRHTVHPHVLRKFFRTKMGAVIPVDVVEALMGHEGYLTEVYRRYSVDDLAKFYVQGELALSISIEAEEIGKLRAEVEERNKTLQTIINGLTAENYQSKQEQAKLKQEQVTVGEKLKELEYSLQYLLESFQDFDSLAGDHLQNLQSLGSSVQDVAQKAKKKRTVHS